jgi:hypothetical protein
MKRTKGGRPRGQEVSSRGEFCVLLYFVYKME